MSSPLVATLSGRCPACGKGRLYAGFLLMNELCPSCGARFERYISTRTVGTVLAFAVGAGLAFGIGSILRGLGEGANLLVPLAAAFGAVLYPLCRNLALFVLWHNGLVTVDAPEPSRDDGRTPRVGPFAPTPRHIVALPQEDDPTQDERPLRQDDPTDDRNG